MTDLLFRIADQGRVAYAVQQDGDLFEVEGDIFDRYRAGAPIPGGLPSVRVLAPVLPSKIVAVGLNYRDHAAEQGKPLPAEPLIFLKPSTAVIGPGDAIRLPPGVGRVDHEAEAGLVIRRRAQLIFPAADLVAFISAVMTLLPGDIISTGTPAGIGPLAGGDVVCGCPASETWSTR